jgi:hypothetical protein
VVLRALSSILIDNDAVGIGLPGNQLGGFQALVSTSPGQEHTVTFDLSPDIIASGHVTIWAQDDHSVESITVNIKGCCVTPYVEPTVIANYPMQTGNEHTPCPGLGVVYARTDASSVPYLDSALPFLDLVCANQIPGAGLKMKSIKFLTCQPDPRGVGFGPNATADITCE